MVETETNLLRVSDVARRLGVTPAAVYNWIRSGQLPSVRVSDTAVRVAPDDLAAYLADVNGVDDAA